ncbi:MAG: hypothetical protein ACR2JH_09130 [Solirubrobacteraceae bacterium]
MSAPANLKEGSDTSGPQAPQFCPWCGTPIAFEAHAHEPRFESLAAQLRARGGEPPQLPERVRDLLSGDSFVGACPGCRIVSHVVSHHSPSA